MIQYKHPQITTRWQIGADQLRSTREKKKSALCVKEREDVANKGADDRLVNYPSIRATSSHVAYWEPTLSGNDHLDHPDHWKCRYHISLDDRGFLSEARRLLGVKRAFHQCFDKGRCVCGRIMVKRSRVSVNPQNTLGGIICFNGKWVLNDH